MNPEKIGTSSVASIPKKKTVRDAERVMRECHVGDAVVTREEGDVSVPIGILTDRDIVVSTVAFGIAPDSVLVGDVMTASLVTARGAIEGIVSAEDITSTLASELSDLAKLSEKQRNIELKHRPKLD